MIVLFITHIFGSVCAAAPDDIVISGEKALGELANLARLEVEFRNEFSNVLCVVTTLVLLQNDKTSTVKMVYDTEFIVSSCNYLKFILCID